ncbi:purine phosphoribosyltransferase family protein [Oceanospirillum sediminis]|uniref:adenine phosphoribosyltransferase n=1 Tax=Oceanospirillum sediminis TaxID=2760088 RepID=A0A839IM47_9GAMM|nr:purine phosphoribosyltransferase family protein [Oceanospirillum sediminis]MBB1485396.1 purine phosphoribosyltransferase family protein [Oceanospirillum sediminis]
MIIDELYLKNLVHCISDFPAKGHKFRDLSPLIADPKALQIACDLLVYRYSQTDISCIVTVSDSGLLTGSIIAYRLQKPLVRVRPSSVIPDTAFSATFTNVSGEQTVAIARNALNEQDRVLLFDDAIASGESMLAAAALVRQCNASIHEACTLVDLPDAGGREKLTELDVPFYALLTFED